MASSLVQTAVERTIARGFTWEWAYMDVPRSVSMERVLIVADKYQRQFGARLERQGFTVLMMSNPFVGEGRDFVADARGEGMAPDMRRYYFVAQCRRRPLVHHMEVPDDQIAEFEKLGMVLAE